MFRRLRKARIDSLGLQRLFRDLWFERHRSRQLVGIAYLFLITIVGTPVAFWYWVGLPFAVLGMLVRTWASGHVKKDKVLATTGPYAYVRHPLYVGNHLIGFGMALASGLWWALPGWILLGLYYYPSTIRHEDAVLHRLFGKSWEAWRARTMALIPRLTPYERGQGSEWSFLQSLKVNGEPIIIAILAGCLYSLYAGI